MGRVREVDRVGNNEADAAAALGRRRVHHSILELVASLMWSFLSSMSSGLVSVW